MVKRSKRSHLFLLYPLTDFILTFIFSFISCLFLTSSFFAYYSSEIIVFSLIETTCFSLIVLFAFWIFRVYKTLTQNFGILEYLKTSLIILVCELFHLVFMLVDPFKVIPCSWVPLIFVLVVTGLALSLVVPMPRMFFRIYNLFKLSISKKGGKRTIVIGAGACGKIAIDESRTNKNYGNKIVLFLDDDPLKINRYYSGILVKGPISNVKFYVEKFKAEEVIIAIPSLKQERLTEIIGYVSCCDVRVRRMPLLSEMEGPNDIKMTDIKIDELLARKPVVLDNSNATKMLNGKTVLVTGAGGSIGSELIRQIFETHPKTLILFDIYENSTYEVKEELMIRKRKENFDDVNIITLIGSTYNEYRVESIIKKYRPNIIFHAAAYKHVPLMEDSPMEAIRTNVIGTYNVAKYAHKYNVEKMILISTDKAVRPTNVMGATKRFAEMIVQYFSGKSNSTKYGAVRFGNVLGSNGSVIPLFQKQINSGGPITITDKNIVRYFMTIPEAVSLVLQCGIFCQGGEIFILDMGEPVKIIDLAAKMIRQCGKVPYKDIDIIETGLRPGEKLYEELLLNVEEQQKTSNNRVYIEKRTIVNEIDKEIQEISKSFELDKNEDIKTLLSSIITTYKPSK